MEIVVSKIAKTAPKKSLEEVKKVGKQISEKVLSEPVQKKAVPIMDKLFFEQYMFAKKLSLKTSNEEIKNLFKLEGDNFLIEAYKFLLEKMGVPETLRPQIVSVPQNEKVGMAYNFISNQLMLNPNRPNANKVEMYGLLRHEFQHLLQNLEVFRNLEIKEEVITAYSKKALEMDLMSVDYIAKNFSLDQIREAGYNDEALKLYAELKDILQKEGEGKFSQKIKNLAEESIPEYKQRYSVLSDLVIKEMGPLKQGSREANRSVKFFNEIFSDLSYWKKDGSVHTGKYITDVRENEALIAGDVAIADIKAILDNEKSCYIQRLKKNVDVLKEQAKNQEKNADEILETSKEINEKFSPKEYIDYLFN